MTKAEKILREDIEAQLKEEETRKKYHFKRAKLLKKLQFSGRPDTNEPIIEIVRLNDFITIDSDMNFDIGLRLSGGQDKVVLKGKENMRRLRDWIDEFLGDSVIQEMKEIKDENTGSL